MNSAQAIQDLINADGWVLDVDGCLVRTARPGGAGGRLIDGAVEFVHWLQAKGRDFIVCTNASQRPAREYAAHLRELGLPVPDERMMTAATAAAEYIAAAHPGARVLPVGDTGLEDALRARGISIATPADAKGGAAPAVVVVGAAEQYSAATINAACLAVADHDAALYTTVDAPWFHGGLQRSVSVSTAIAAAITSVTGRAAQVCGKPSPAIGQVLRNRLGGADRRLVVVGDMASIEIRLAHQMDAMGVLVLSGATSAGEVPALPPEHRPHVTAADLGELVRRMKSFIPRGDK